MGEARRIRVFFNEDSGAGGVSAETIRSEFSQRGCSCEVTPLNERLDWRGWAARDGGDVVWVAAGGDGTVNALAAACAGTERAMAVLPVGTFNHFARDLGMPLRLQEAIDAVATCPARRVDAAEANGLVFVNNSSLGVYPAMVIDRDRMRRSGGSKRWAMVKASARAFARYRSMEVEFEVEGKSRRCKTALLFVGNNRYRMEGGRIGQRVRLDEGVLSVSLIVGATRWAMLKVFAAALIGRGKDVGELEEFVARSFKVKAHGRRRLRVAFDGEVKRMSGPLQYKAMPGALRVIAPDAGAR
jgi:diacylglycerol kinase family enzyme